MKNTTTLIITICITIVILSFYGIADLFLLISDTHSITISNSRSTFGIVVSVLICLLAIIIGFVALISFIKHSIRERIIFESEQQEKVPVNNNQNLNHDL